MDYKILALRDIIRDEISETEYRDKIANEFECPINTDVETFLRDKSIEFEKMDISRTYFIYAQFRGNQCLVGYFALALKPINVRSGVSRRIKQCITGNSGRNEASIFLIGQLGKNYKNGINEYSLISGEQLLHLALEQILLAYQILGGRAILVECQNNEYLKNFYESMGFEQVDKDSSDGLLRYYINISSINLSVC